jgi:hypothetical protein
VSFLSTCYGADIDALADEGGGFVTVTSSTIANFVLRQWIDVATTIGFLHPFNSVARALPSSRAGLTGLHSAAMATFEQWHRARPRESSTLSVSARLARARAREELLVQYAARRPGNLWAIDEPASSVAGSGCFEQGPGVRARAFLDDSAPNYFHGARGGSQDECGPVFLSIGTFPWVYGGRLHRTPPGLDWEEAGRWSPAVTAMRLCASLWQPEGNLAQDARVVVLAYRAYRQSVDEALRSVPSHDARAVVPGRLHRRGHWLDAAQSSLEVHTVAGPRGPLTASVHNYIVRRFAAFFALRRSLLSAAAQLTPDLRRVVAQNPDPCVRPLAQGVEARA